MAKKWNPRPTTSYSEDQRKGYFAGYSDGHYGYARGTAYADSRPASYDAGYDEARADLASKPS